MQDRVLCVCVCGHSLTVLGLSPAVRGGPDVTWPKKATEKDRDSSTKISDDGCCIMSACTRFGACTKLLLQWFRAVRTLIRADEGRHCGTCSNQRPVEIFNVHGQTHLY